MSTTTPNSNKNNNNIHSRLHASTTTETTTTASSISLKPPPELNDEDAEMAFENYVQKTYGRYPLTLTSGKGCKLFSSTTNETYLDFVSGIATCALGHAHPALINAISDQIQTLHHVSNLYYIPAQARLAQWLVENSVAEKVFFCNSGAEANEGAIKLARRFAHNRGITDPVIITAHNSFHGRTLAALSATGQSKYHRGFGYGNEMVPGFEYVPYNDMEALKKKVEEINDDSLTDLGDGRKRGVAAILLEPLQGEGGIIPGSPPYFQLARTLCNEHNALLLLDEVQTGMGRCGTLWAHEQLHIEPDVFTSAKALGGGVPIGAMMARGKAAVGVLGPGDHASTYGGNPLACAAGLAVAKVLVEENLLENVRVRGEELVKGLEGLREKYGGVLGEVRGWGLLRGVEVLEGSGTSAGELVGEAMKEGLLLVPAGANVVRFVPPLIVSKEEVEEALVMFESVLRKKFGGDVE